MPVTEDEIAAVRAEFVAEGRRQCAVLLGRIGRDFDTAGACRIAHRWNGLGGSVGLPGITRAARALERLLRTGQPIAAPVLERRLRELGDMFAEAG